jgi:hypothetical protein
MRGTYVPSHPNTVSLGPTYRLFVVIGRAPVALMAAASAPPQEE